MAEYCCLKTYFLQIHDDQKINQSNVPYQLSGIFGVDFKCHFSGQIAFLVNLCEN
jgi:hypothetical protein